MKKINYLDSINFPLITEKATSLSEQNKIIFKVHKNASKISIKKNIEKIFKVNVIKINTINKKPRSKIVRGKLGFKKAIISQNAKTISNPKIEIKKVNNLIDFVSYLKSIAQING